MLDQGKVASVNAKDPNPFELIQSRLSNARQAVYVTTGKIRECANALNGPDPEKGADHVPGGESSDILGAISDHLSDLESQIAELDTQQNRISLLFT
jgi:hypothetical protein